MGIIHQAGLRAVERLVEIGDDVVIDAENLANSAYALTEPGWIRTPGVGGELKATAGYLSSAVVYRAAGVVQTVAETITNLV